MRNNLLKLCSSILLLVLMFVTTFADGLLVTFGIITCIVSLIKFLIVMILEPDDLLETIKKFIYVFIMIAAIFGIVFNNNICFIILSVIVAFDTILEILRFIRNSKKIEKI